MLGRLREEVVDEVVPEFDVEMARILGRVLRIGVVHREIAAMRCRVEVDLATEAILPSRMADQSKAAIGMPTLRIAAPRQGRVDYASSGARA